MNRAIRIRANHVINDLLSGMSNQELMRKYMLGVKELETIFQKLVDAGVVAPGEFDDRMPQPTEVKTLPDTRMRDRCYPVVSLPISDMDDLRVEGEIRDFTEQGVQVKGILCETGQKRHFLVQAHSFAAVRPFSFSAQCKWVKTEAGEGGPSAGFEITDITAEGMVSLRKLLDTITFCD